MVWSTTTSLIITQTPPSWLLLATAISELDKIYPLTSLSGLLNVSWDSSMKIILENVFWGPILEPQNICFSEKRSLIFFFFLQIPIPKVSYIFYSSWLPQFLLFSKIWVLFKSVCFAITCLSLCSFQQSKFLKYFPLSLQLSHIFKSLLNHSMISMKFLWYPQFVLHSITLLFSLFQ